MRKSNVIQLRTRKVSKFSDKQLASFLENYYKLSQEDQKAIHALIYSLASNFGGLANA